MSTVKVKATSGFRYGGKIIKAGEILECTPNEAKSLEALGCKPVIKKNKQKSISDNKIKNETEINNG